MSEERDDVAAAAEERFDARLRVALGDEGLARLSKACVMVLGLGGVGSNCVVALARGGVGHLVLVDRDTVSVTNINRQAVARHSTVGRAKTEVMREMIADINPECEVTCLTDFIARDTVAEQLDALPRPDYVVDAIDTIAQKLAIAEWCHERGYREVAAMGSANKYDPTRYKFADIDKTESDPLARIMRKQCRKRGIKGLEVLYSDEIPRKATWDSENVAGGEEWNEQRGASLGSMS